MFIESLHRPGFHHDGLPRPVRPLNVNLRLNPKTGTPEQLLRGLFGTWLMTGQGVDVFMDGIDDPFFLGKEGVLQLHRWGNPITSPDDDHGPVTFERLDEILKGLD